MNDLYGLIRVCNFFEEVSSIKRMTKKGTLEGLFIEGLLKKKFKNDQLANNILFGCDTNLAKYRMLKSRVRDKLFTIVCERYLETRSKADIEAEKVYLFFNEINFQGHKYLAFYYLKRYLSKERIIDLNIRIKLIDLFTQIGWELGKFACVDNYIKEVIQLRKEISFRKAVLKKCNEYIINKNKFPQVYKKAFLKIVIDDFEKKNCLLRANFLFQTINCLKIFLYYEFKEFDKIVLQIRENDSLINIGCYCILPGCFKILNLLYYSESLIRLKHYDMVCNILGKALKNFPVTINDSSLVYELLELQIIAHIKQKKYCAARNLLKGINEKKEFLIDQEKIDKICTLSKAIGLMINEKISSSVLRKSHGSYSHNKAKFCSDYLLLDKLLSIITDCRNNKISISKKDMRLLREEYERYVSNAQKEFSPFEELINDIYRLKISCM